MGGFGGSGGDGASSGFGGMGSLFGGDSGSGGFDMGSMMDIFGGMLSGGTNGGNTGSQGNGENGFMNMFSSLFGSMFGNLNQNANGGYLKKYNDGGSFDMGSIMSMVGGITNEGSDENSSSGGMSGLGSMIGSVVTPIALAIKGDDDVQKFYSTGVDPTGGNNIDAYKSYRPRLEHQQNRYTMANGGMMNSLGGNGDLMEYQGNSHAEGGIPVDQNGVPTNRANAVAEVEGGETKLDDYIFSDKNKIPGKKKTFADESKAIESKYRKRIETGDRIAKKSRDRELNDLMKQQEEYNEVMGYNDEEQSSDNSALMDSTTDKYCKGGKMKKYDNGGELGDDEKKKSYS